MTVFVVTLLPGDGIGPEVVQAGERVLETMAVRGGFAVHFQHVAIGGAALEAYGEPLREVDLVRCAEGDALLLGAVGGPHWERVAAECRPERGLLRLRSALGLGINLRPIRASGVGESPLKREVTAGADIAFVRELTGGIYFGRPSAVWGEAPERVAVDTARYDERQIEAVIDFAFGLAGTRGGRVTSVDKANVLHTSRLWRQVADDRARRFPAISLEHALVDSFALSLMQNPGRYDVVVTDNLFGDILTDLAAVIAGSIGLLPSASLRPGGGGQRLGLYEPIHGSAPDLAGQGSANPVGCILSVALMLEWSLGRPDLGQAVRRSVDTVLSDGHLTPDLGGTATTDQVTEAILSQLRPRAPFFMSGGERRVNESEQKGSFIGN